MEIKLYDTAFGNNKDNSEEIAKLIVDTVNRQIEEAKEKEKEKENEKWYAVRVCHRGDPIRHRWEIVSPTGEVVRSFYVDQHGEEGARKLAQHKFDEYNRIVFGEA